MYVCAHMHGREFEYIFQKILKPKVKEVKLRIMFIINIIAQTTATEWYIVHLFCFLPLSFRYLIILHILPDSCTSRNEHTLLLFLFCC